MIVDCDRCVVRGAACQDCVITVLLGAPPDGVELDGTQRWALDALAEAGMVPALRLVDRLDSHGTEYPATHRENHPRERAERSGISDERSRRYVS